MLNTNWNWRERVRKVKQSRWPWYRPTANSMRSTVWLRYHPEFGFGYRPHSLFSFIQKKSPDRIRRNSWFTLVGHIGFEPVTSWMWVAQYCEDEWGLSSNSRNSRDLGQDAFGWFRNPFLENFLEGFCTLSHNQASENLYPVLIAPPHGKWIIGRLICKIGRSVFD